MEVQPDTVIWGIHTGKIPDPDSYFMKNRLIGIGWGDMGDLSILPANREAFKQKVKETYPEKKPGGVSNSAGQTYRYVHEMKEGDLVVYPSYKEKMINIGKITGPYTFSPTVNKKFPNIRKVNWLKSISRTHFTQGALYEMGSALTIFQIKNYTDEIISALSREVPSPSVDEDETVSVVAKDIEQTTKDFILKKLTSELKGHPFENFIAHLLQIMGYQTRISPIGPDNGIDIIAHKDELGFEPPIIKVQVKTTEGNIGEHVVAALSGNVDKSEYGLFVTLGSFTNQAKNFARSKANLRLVDGEELIELFLRHYENFDSRYKGLIPLKKVYVPEVIEEDE